MKINIVAHPNSKNPRIERDLLDSLHVYVNAPPLEGRANKEILETLASYFKVKKSQIELTSGFKSKNKTFQINPTP